jgi:leader peptidase (prepilin peptidase)/N-methyltransferase
VSVLVAAVCAIGAAAGGAAVPWVIRQLPEPAPEPEPEPEEEAGTVEDVEDVEDVEEAPAPRRQRRPVPDFSLWGMHAIEREKEPYPEMGAVPHLLVGSVLVCAVVGGLLGWWLGADPALAIVLPVVPVGVAIAVVDWRARLVPNRLVLPATAYVIVAGLVIWAVTSDHTDLVRAAVSLAVVRSFFWVMWFIRAAGMGFGDVRLSALLGFVLGWIGPGEVFFGVWIGFLVFGLPGLLVALAKRDYRLMRVPFPFGPFMLVGALLGVFLGQPVVDALYG